MGETPDSKETNAELICFFVTLPALIVHEKKAPKRDPIGWLASINVLILCLRKQMGLG